MYPPRPPGHKAKQSEVLIDLVGLDLQGPPSAAASNHQQAPPTSLSIPADLLFGTAVTTGASPEPQDPSLVPSAARSLLDEELLSLGDQQTSTVAVTTLRVTEQVGHGLVLLHVLRVLLCEWLAGIGDPPAPLVSPSTVTRPEPLDHQLTSLQVGQLF